MKKQIVFLVFLLALAAPCQEQMKLAVLEPEGKGLSKDEQWMLSLVQSSIAGDFNKYSGITIIDRQNLEAIIAEQKRSLSAMTSDEAIRIGNLANASHILIGKITKTPKAFMLDLAITEVETGKRKASHSPKAVTPSSLEDLSALKEASADLLKQLGVELTDSQLEELRGPAASAQVQAQTALAHGVVAQRHGTSVAALSYYYQAAAFDPTLAEAVSRSSVVSANISGINLGENIRNDIVWRKNWVEQLKETEETFSKIINAAAPPYSLFYSTAIETKNINYQTETADLSIPLHLLANLEWFNAMQRTLKAAQAVMDGLNATNRKNDWGLADWPMKGVSSTNPFAAYMERSTMGYNIGWKPYGKQYNIPVEFELLNQRGKVIGKQTVRLNPSFSINNNFTVQFDPRLSGTLTFKAVKAGEISDNLTIRIASVNGAPPKTAKFPITAISTKWPPDIIKRIAFTDSRDGKKYVAVDIGAQTWMAENLSFDAEGSKCCEDNPTNCQRYGRLYDWNTAMKVCPEGWHLPTIAEWDKLIFYGTNNQKSSTVHVISGYAGKDLKAKSGWKDGNTIGGKSFNGNGLDSYGFAALPGGRGFSDGSFYDVGDYGDWWSATEGRGGDEYSEAEAYSRKMSSGGGIYSGDEVRGGDPTPGRASQEGDRKSDLNSVRCVKD